MRLGIYEQETLKKRKREAFIEKATVAITSFVLGYAAACIVASLILKYS